MPPEAKMRMKNIGRVRNPRGVHLIASVSVLHIVTVSMSQTRRLWL
uniref:Uncharacterized protein n=1 Tax=Anguilla anguilla TaxID=7936 RepID=A0A0E9TWX4_ANGAN